MHLPPITAVATTSAEGYKQSSFAGKPNPNYFGWHDMDVDEVDQTNDVRT
jgi:hypothetical protein